jgi:hypothetical protein
MKFSENERTTRGSMREPALYKNVGRIFRIEQKVKNFTHSRGPYSSNAGSNYDGPRPFLENNGPREETIVLANLKVLRNIDESL